MASLGSCLHVALAVSPERLLLPVTVPSVLVMVKVLENAVREPPLPVVKLPASVKVPGKGPAAVPLTEKLTFPSDSRLQVPVRSDGGRGPVRVSPASEEGVAACALAVPSPSTPTIRHPVNSSNRRASRPPAPRTTGLITPSFGLRESRDPKSSRKPPSAAAA